MDISEGKRTLMVIYTLKKAMPTDKRRLQQILSMHTNDQKFRDEAITIMKKYKAIEYAREYAHKIVKEGWDDVDKMLPTSAAKEKLRAFIDYLVERKI